MTMVKCDRPENVIQVIIGISSYFIDCRKLIIINLEIIVTVGNV